MLQVHLMAVDLGRLGLLLAALSDPAELADPATLSSRVAPGGNEGAGGRWKYELVTGRYPHWLALAATHADPGRGRELPGVLRSQCRSSAWLTGRAADR